ncbi:ATP-binding protein [Mycolicibacterium fortuitum]|uniref:ATP-binding protein n=1 Tax=Mycolicibacterium TaxID=1866885 RepID=UPI003204B892
MRLPAPTSTLVTAGDVTTAVPTMASRVDPEGARRMMDILINLYADRRLAVVREYVSNAVDATRMADSTVPVQVTSPTELEPNLIVTDAGIGMSAAEVEATFLAFAASTKRDSNDQIGGLGVGAKSALTVAESFLVDTIKGGRRTVVRAARDLTHQVLLADSPSELPSGTTITVAVEVEGQLDKWNSVIREVASAHPEGTVLVDGKPVASLSGGLRWVGPVGCLRAGDRTVTVLSGGTLFDAVPEVADRVLAATRLQAAVIELPIGSFDHTPSRESVVATERTLAAVDAALETFTQVYRDLEVQVATLALNDVHAAATLRASILGDVARADLLPVPFHAVVPAGSGVRFGSEKGRRTNRRRWKIAEPGEVVFTALGADRVLKDVVVVTDVPVRRGLRSFATLMSETHSEARWVVPIVEGSDHLDLAILGEGDTATGQVWSISAESPGVTVYAYTDWLAATTTKRAPRSGLAGYDTRVVATDGGPQTRQVLTGAEIAELGLPVWYVEGNPHYSHDSRLDSSQAVAVYLGRRKPGPLLAAVPAAQPYHEWAIARFDAESEGWTDIERIAAAVDAQNYWSNDRMRLALATDVVPRITADHPLRDVLVRLSEIETARCALTPTHNAVMTRAARLGIESGPLREVSRLLTSINKAYPLLDHMRGNVSEAVRQNLADYLVHTPPRLPVADNDSVTAA